MAEEEDKKPKEQIQEKPKEKPKMEPTVIREDKKVTEKR